MKKALCILSFFVLLSSFFACQDKAAMAELERYRAQAAVEEQNKALLNRMWEAWNRGDFEAWKQMHADEYAYYSPSNSTEPLSREETIEMGKVFFRGFPDATTSIEGLITAGDTVITRWILRGTHKGEFAGIPATGKVVVNSGIMITRIENGKVVEDKEDYDSLGMMQQLGMELKPTEAKKK
jgi:steroid delta-isomerase-like uncharacterized protein